MIQFQRSLIQQLSRPKSLLTNEKILVRCQSSRPDESLDFTTQSLANPDHFKRVIERFPAGDTKNGRPIWPLAFAYGSGVFKQPGNVSKSNMTDFILVVEDSEDWHAQNLKMNPKDYSGK